ncbi:hypothetical protein MMC29_003282 [Sticta canariensis]|nr:hypothetical protein [Sticta canariensis]
MALRTSSFSCRQRLSPQRCPSPKRPFEPLFPQEPRLITETPVENSLLDTPASSSRSTVIIPTSSGTLLASRSSQEKDTTAPFPTDLSDSSNPMHSITPSSPALSFSSKDIPSLANLDVDNSSDSSFQPTSPPVPPRRLRRTRPGNRKTPSSIQAEKVVSEEKKKFKKSTTIKTGKEARKGRKESKWRLDREDWRLIAGAKRERRGGDGVEESRKKRRRS